VSCAEMAEPIDLPFALWTRWVEWSTSSIIFGRWRQCATWQIWLNRLSAAAMWSYVKLLWALVIITKIIVTVRHPF